ncbi:DUF6228 family protein [Nocardia sp. XZ_19_369]|uniref:DUF6228 family protein n=1 Tax=Nocardia sp. XZ_19_369 TaxID=2769487 RepID=UPI00188F3285|nr:DUF6228 family protein [Nocardia sp. XZ_19_369]
MTCEFDSEMVERDEAIELMDRSDGTGVRLWHRTVPYSDDYVAVCVELSADGMVASMRGLILDYVAGRSLPGFISSLERDFAGWQGIRTWESMDHELRIEARHSTLGHVQLDWSLCRQSSESLSWTATVVTYLEAGEQLRQFAAAIHRFVLPDDAEDRR